MTRTLAVWAAVTAWHFVLTDRAASRVCAGRQCSLDERVFASAVLGVATLSLVLHTVAIASGLGLTTGVLGLAAWHFVLRMATPVSARERPLATAAPWRATIGESVALAVIAGIVLTWVGLAARSTEALGPDAAHYHVPYALNFATGASPFDLPATPHLYPMVGSLIGAWFIVPLGDPLIVDLALVLPFVLIAASVNALFRSTTGRSGALWASWFTLGLFSTPMFRMTSLGSADLWFAAGFVSLVAVIVQAWARGAWRGLDVMLAAGSAGLLAGSKATGAPALALIVAVSFAIAIARRLDSGRWLPRPDRLARTGIAAVALFLGAGGIWLIRNWVLFGSPIAPAGLTVAGVSIFDGETFQRSKYLSVLAEMDTDSFHLWARTKFFVAQRFGAWYLALLWPIAWLAVDLIARARRRATDGLWWPRLGVLGLTVLTGAVLVWMLIGAPWTGMERSRGLTLRYLLPIAGLLPLLAFVACFPMALFAWHRRGSLRAIALAGVVAGGLWLFWESLGSNAQAIRALPVPGLSALWLMVAIVWVWLLRAGASAARGLTRIGAALLLIGVMAWWSPRIAQQGQEARARATQQLRAEESAALAAPAGGSVWRPVLPAVRAAELAEGRTCRARRFFSLVRFDEPLALQPPEFGSQVFYAARDLEAARRAGPMAGCDYIITSAPMAGTDKGAALAAALAGPRELRSFASTKDFLVLTVRSSNGAVRP